jgi:hypothetical protein
MMDEASVNRNPRPGGTMFPKLKVIAVLTIICHAILPIDGFVQNGPFVQRNPLAQGPTATREPRAVGLFMAKLWDRMQIEEDPEPMWYVLNCVAGLEMDLLRHCRKRLEDMEDAEKFVVLSATNTRSHGANRMVMDTKVTYPGYVFAKLRLCPETYEAIQGE